MTLVPVNVAQLVVLVGTMVEGKIILIVPDDDRASNVVMLISYVVLAQTVVTVAAAEPDRVEGSACTVAVPVILA